MAGAGGGCRRWVVGAIGGGWERRREVVTAGWELLKKQNSGVRPADCYAQHATLQPTTLAVADCAAVGQAQKMRKGRGWDGMGGVGDEGSSAWFGQH